MVSSYRPAHSYTQSDPHPSQIFNHCDPVSLVQLTKTSIILRDMLLECSQSMIRLWKQRYTAYTGYELPPTADDISLPRLACLIVDESCSVSLFSRAPYTLLTYFAHSSSATRPEGTRRRP